MIIAITGTNAAGKGAIVDYLVAQGFRNFSVRAFLTEEIKKRDLIENRDSLRFIANELRQEYGPDYNVRTLYDRAIKVESNAVIESIRCPGEVAFITSQENTHFIAVDADPHIRYERAVKRGSSTDKVTFEKFMSDEERESIGAEAWDMNIPLCIMAAEKVFMNNGTLEEFHREIDSWLYLISFSK